MSDFEEIEEKALEQEAVIRALRKRGKESQETTADTAESPVGDGSRKGNGLLDSSNPSWDGMVDGDESEPKGESA